jgi:hypothetical protein
MPKPAKFSNGKKLSDAEYNQELKEYNKKQSRKPLSDAVKKTLLKKAEETKFTYTQLAAVYRRGQGAYLSGGKRNVSMTQWAMGRVNSFIQGGKARKADADIYSKNQKLDINKQLKKLLNQIKKAKDKESVETAFDEIQNLILNKKDCIEIDHINELYKIEKKYGTQLKNQIYKKPDTYLERYGKCLPKEILDNLKEQEKSMLESGHLRPLLERYSMILPPEVREKLEEGTLIFNTTANEVQIVDANDTAKVVGTIENPNSKEWVGGLVDKDGNREEIRATNSTFKPEDVQKNYKYIQGLTTTEKAFYFKYVSPIGYYSWHKVASNYITNYKNNSQEKRFKVFSSPAYYLTDELAMAFINTPVKNLKFDEEPKIVNNSFFVFQSIALNNVKYVFVDCVYEKGFVYLHISHKKNCGFNSHSIKFAWNDLANYKKTDGTKETNELIENQFNIIVNMILLMNQQPDIEVEYMPPSITIPVQRGFSKPEVFKPRPITWVGKEFSKRIVKIYPNTDDLLPKQPGMPKRSHWRRGHWHTVLQGPRREQRRMKWYEPVFIKGKKLGV